MNQNEKKQKKALFLDRDGVINVDRGYVHTREQWEWCPGIFELLKWGRQNYDHIIVLTNQSGVGLGLYDKECVHKLHQWVDGQLKERQLKIDAWYFCPFHPEGKLSAFKGDSLKRKPEPGMALKAREDWNLDLSRSLMIGDKKTDRLRGLNMETLFIQGNYELQGESPVFPDHFELLRFLSKRA